MYFVRKEKFDYGGLRCESQAMGDSMEDFCRSRGALGVLIVLNRSPQRFTDLKNALHVSESTLTARLGEARDIGFVTPEMDTTETSVDNQYRLSERGAYVVRKLEQDGIVHAYLQMLDAHETVEEGRESLVDWIQDTDSKNTLMQYSDSDPYVDEFGEDITGYGDTD